MAGHITPKGYRRIQVSRDPVRYKMEHVLVWERAHGPVPKGFCIHHKNHDKLDNRLGNLELMEWGAHRRIHTGSELRADGWWKLCRVCRKWKPLAPPHWYFQKITGWVEYGKCRRCHIAKVVAAERERRRSRE